MGKKIRILLSILVTFAAVSAYAVFSHDHRTAASLSAYCNIDFIGEINPQTGSAVGATLQITDIRYASAPLENILGIDIDGQKYLLSNAKVSSRPPSYSLTSLPGQATFKHTNTLWVSFPPQIFQEIVRAHTVKISFKYADRNTPFEFMLNAADLAYWKKQLPL